MDHNLKMFVTLYVLSMIPFFLAFLTNERQVQWGLALFDTALTWASLVYLYQVIGIWWLLFAIVCNIALGMILKGLDINPYWNLTN